MKEAKSKFFLNEDWAAVVVAFFIIALFLTGVTVAMPAWKWQSLQDLANLLTDRNRMVAILFLWIFMYAAIVIAFLLQGTKISIGHIGGHSFIFFITIVALVITGNSSVQQVGLEVVLFSLLIGLTISNFFKIPRWAQPMIQTELYIKIGLVLLGCGIIFQDILKAGQLGLIQSLAVVVVVWQVGFWISKKFHLDDELRTMLASAVAICGVSAAIATAGAIKGDSKKLSYIISLVLITAIPMMLLMPPLAKAMNLPDAVSGAWLGGTIDTTGAVVAAGTVLGDESLKYATVVKFSQNVLLGLAAFVISVYWTYQKKEGAEKPSLKTI